MSSPLAASRRVKANRFFQNRVEIGAGPDDPLQLVLECTGAKKKEKAAKVTTAKHLWTPAVNNAGDHTCQHHALDQPAKRKHRST